MTEPPVFGQRFDERPAIRCSVVDCKTAIQSVRTTSVAEVAR